MSRFEIEVIERYTPEGKKRPRIRRRKFKSLEELAAWANYELAQSAFYSRELHQLLAQTFLPKQAPR